MIRSLLAGSLLVAFAALVHGEDKPTGIPGLANKPANLAEAKAAADRLEKMYKGKTQPESVRMFIAIARGSQMMPGDGWFGPAQTRYTWPWLAKTCGLESKAKEIPRGKFAGPDLAFSKLDRNKDGKITPDELDWSDRNPYVQQSYMINRLFRMMDRSGDGKLSRQELLAFYEKASAGKDHLTSDDLRDALLAGSSGGFSPGDAPKTETLLEGLFGSEIGSLQEGPKVGDPAPDFTLATRNGEEKVTLSKLLGKKPVVLVLGNFSCGPFRSMYPLIEDVRKRHGKDAEFLMVYVREAHPTDGWRMKSNDKVGVSVSQPRTLEARCEVAEQFTKKLTPTIPLVVDTLDDRVGNAYSGMPARLYVIDRAGKIAYKSGRGPFGFKVPELEQALVMALLEK